MTNSVSFIGSGRVATQMALAFRAANVPILQVYSRNLANAEKLTKLLQEGEAIDDLANFKDESTLNIVAVSDDAIGSIAQNLRLERNLLVHTSGSIPLSALDGAAKKTAIFYPLQSFQLDRVPNWKEIPMFLESAEDANYSVLEYFANKISNTVNRLDSEKRKHLHLAAVFANNFSNFLYQISYELLEKEGLKFEYLIPLLKEMGNRLGAEDPAELQTGPARRGDEKTIAAHIEMLKTHPEYQEIYAHFSALILKKFN